MLRTYRLNRRKQGCQITHVVKQGNKATWYWLESEKTIHALVLKSHILMPYFSQRPLGLIILKILFFNISFLVAVVRKHTVNGWILLNETLTWATSKCIWDNINRHLYHFKEKPWRQNVLYWTATRKRTGLFIFECRNISKWKCNIQHRHKV
jgi:thiosulfate reductase cytochrome b subunit